MLIRPRMKSVTVSRLSFRRPISGGEVRVARVVFRRFAKTVRTG